jgi:hypothetical protein
MSVISTEIVPIFSIYGNVEDKIDRRIGEKTISKMFYSKLDLERVRNLNDKLYTWNSDITISQQLDPRIKKSIVVKLSVRLDDNVADLTQAIRSHLSPKPERRKIGTIQLKNISSHGYAPEEITRIGGSVDYSDDLAEIIRELGVAKCIDFRDNHNIEKTISFLKLLIFKKWSEIKTIYGYDSPKMMIWSENLSKILKRNISREIYEETYNDFFKTDETSTFINDTHIPNDIKERMAGILVDREQIELRDIIYYFHEGSVKLEFQYKLISLDLDNLRNDKSLVEYMSKNPNTSFNIKHFDFKKKRGQFINSNKCGGIGSDAKYTNDIFRKIYEAERHPEIPENIKINEAIKNKYQIMFDEHAEMLRAMPEIRIGHAGKLIIYEYNSYSINIIMDPIMIPRAVPIGIPPTMPKPSGIFGAFSGRIPVKLESAPSLPPGFTLAAPVLPLAPALPLAPPVTDYNLAGMKRRFHDASSSSIPEVVVTRPLTEMPLAGLTSGMAVPDDSKAVHIDKKIKERGEYTGSEGDIKMSGGSNMKSELDYYYQKYLQYKMKYHELKNKIKNI